MIDDGDSSFPTYTPPPARKTGTVGSGEEIKAIGGCCEALEPVAHDRAALRRIYDYLKSRFPPAPNTRQRRGRGLEEPD
jgi:hypothetical protein